MPRMKTQAQLCGECLARNRKLQGKVVYIPTVHEMKLSKLALLREAGCTEDELMLIFKTTRRGLGFIARENHKRNKKAAIALANADAAANA